MSIIKGAQPNLNFTRSTSKLVLTFHLFSSYIVPSFGHNIDFVLSAFSLSLKFYEVDMKEKQGKKRKIT